MKKSISISLIFLSVFFKLFSQEPIIIWDKISFGSVKIPDLEKTVINGRDTTIKTRFVYPHFTSPMIFLTGRIINKSDSTIYIYEKSFKLEYVFNNSKQIIDLYLAPGKDFFNDLKLDPNKSWNIFLESNMAPFENNKYIFKSGKINYIDDILKIIPTILIKSHFEIYTENPSNLVQFDFNTKIIKSVGLQWYNYIPFEE
jgi:hypothetical protein